MNTNTINNIVVHEKRYLNCTEVTFYKRLSPTRYQKMTSRGVWGCAWYGTEVPGELTDEIVVIRSKKDLSNWNGKPVFWNSGYTGGKPEDYVCRYCNKVDRDGNALVQPGNEMIDLLREDDANANLDKCLYGIQIAEQYFQVTRQNGWVLITCPTDDDRDYTLSDKEKIEKAKKLWRRDMALIANTFERQIKQMLSQEANDFAVSVEHVGYGFAIKVTSKGQATRTALIDCDSNGKNEVVYERDATTGEYIKYNLEDWVQKLSSVATEDIAREDADNGQQHCTASMDSPTTKEGNKRLMNAIIERTGLIDSLFVTPKNNLIQKLRDASRNKDGVIVADISDDDAPLLMTHIITEADGTRYATLDSLDRFSEADSKQVVLGAPITRKEDTLRMNAVAIYLNRFDRLKAGYITSGWTGHCIDVYAPSCMLGGSGDTVNWERVLFVVDLNTSTAHAVQYSDTDSRNKERR